MRCVTTEVARVGLEPYSIIGETADGYNTGGISVGTESGIDREFLGTDGLIFDAFAPDLQQVIDAWPTLPETVLQDILAMVETIEANPSH